MLKMTEQTRVFLEAHIPQALDMADVNDALDLISDFVTLEGIDMDPVTKDFGDVNALGREAYQAYDDLFEQND